MAHKMKKAMTYGTSEHEGKAWGRGEYANMPQDVKKDMYPKNRGATGSLDDTITGIDKAISSSEKTVSRFLSNQH